jgi:hypothetical protein
VSSGVGDTPNRRAAAAAAREFRQAQFNCVADIADAARAIEAAVEAQAAAARHVAECQRAYGRTRRAAVAAGWAEAELTQLGWPPEYGPGALQQRRRRPAAAAATPEPSSATLTEHDREPAGANAGSTSAGSVERDRGTDPGTPAATHPGRSGEQDQPVGEVLPSVLAAGQHIG